MKSPVIQVIEESLPMGFVLGRGLTEIYDLLFPIDTNSEGDEGNSFLCSQACFSFHHYAIQDEVGGDGRVELLGNSAG